MERKSLCKFKNHLGPYTLLMGQTCRFYLPGLSSDHELYVINANEKCPREKVLLHLNCTDGHVDFAFSKFPFIFFVVFSPTGIPFIIQL